MKSKFIFLLALLFGTAVFMTVRADPEPGPEPDADADADADPDPDVDADPGPRWTPHRPSHYNYRRQCPADYTWSNWYRKCVCSSKCSYGYTLDYRSCSCKCSKKCSYGYKIGLQ